MIFVSSLILGLGAGKAGAETNLVTFAGNFDLGTRETQFFESNHNAFVGQWDTRIEFWLPPSRAKFSWGPYLRVAGIAASKNPAWENAWLAGPGAGIQVYPFSLPSFRKSDSIVGQILGPVRLFGEYSRLNYWGKENSWRPNNQKRIGVEYWGAFHVNDAFPAWLEIWSGVWRQSSNEFDSHYNTQIFAVSSRGGLRIPNADSLSAFTPYIALESSSTNKNQYYWENRLNLGGGLRYAPLLNNDPAESVGISRLVLYVEYIKVSTYYHSAAPSSVPDHDVRMGISMSIGEWFR